MGDTDRREAPAAGAAEGPAQALSLASAQASTPEPASASSSASAGAQVPDEDGMHNWAGKLNPDAWLRGTRQRIAANPAPWFEKPWSATRTHELTRGSLSRRFEWFQRYTAMSVRLPFGRNLLRGQQRSGHPVAALKTRRFMEVPRHVVAQRVVAGTHITPFGSRGWGNAPNPFGMAQPGPNVGVGPGMTLPPPPESMGMSQGMPLGALPGMPLPPPFIPGRTPAVPPPGEDAGRFSPEGVDLDPLGFLVELTK